MLKSEEKNIYKKSTISQCRRISEVGIFYKLRF